MHCVRSSTYQPRPTYRYSQAVRELLPNCFQSAMETGIQGKENGRDKRGKRYTLLPLFMCDPCNLRPLFTSFLPSLVHHHTAYHPYARTSLLAYVAACQGSDSDPYTGPCNSTTSHPTCATTCLVAGAFVGSWNSPSSSSHSTASAERCRTILPRP